MNSKRQPIIMCLDVSGSMSLHNRMNRLNEAIELFWATIINKTRVASSCDVAILTFHHSIVQEPEFECFDELEVPHFDAIEDSGTNMSLALKKALESIDAYRIKCQRADIETHVPILLFVTDGDPDDHKVDMNEVIAEITRRRQAKTLAPMIIGVGDDAVKYSAKLDRLTGGFAGGHALIVSDTAKDDILSEYFKGLSNSVIGSVTAGDSKDETSTYDQLEETIVRQRKTYLLDF